MSLFDFFAKKKDLEKETLSSIAPPTDEDDSIVVGAGGVNAYSLSGIDSVKMTETDAIDTWREFADRAEVSTAVQEIVNEAVISEGDKFQLSLICDDLDGVPKSIQKKLTTEFEEILRILRFKRHGQELFRRWYIDGKQYFHMIVDSENLKQGIQEIRWIDPKTMRKVIEMEIDPKSPPGVKMEKVKETYYVYTTFASTRRSQGAFSSSVNSGLALKVSPEAIAYSNSGVSKKDPNTGNTYSVSYLDRALRVGNQLRLLEDSVVIYRLSRAPERRVFYIDVGNLPKTKAEQYLRDVMNRFRNKVTYDPVTGNVQDQRNVLSIMEDFWLPRREGGRGTEVTTLEAGQNLGELTDVEYFYRNLYKALQIPSTRLQSDSMFNVGRSAEITREEVKFQKFITSLRNKFSEAMFQMLKTQVVLKNIMTGVEFDDIAGDLGLKWGTDSYWEELKNSEVIASRLSLLSQADNFVGRYFSREWVNKNILNMTDEEIETEKQRMADEPPPEPEDGMGSVPVPYPGTEQPVQEPPGFVPSDETDFQS